MRAPSSVSCQWPTRQHEPHPSRLQRSAANHCTAACYGLSIQVNDMITTRSSRSGVFPGRPWPALSHSPIQSPEKNMVASTSPSASLPQPLPTALVPRQSHHDSLPGLCFPRNFLGRRCHRHWLARPMSSTATICMVPALLGRPSSRASMSQADAALRYASSPCSVRTACHPSI